MYPSWFPTIVRARKILTLVVFTLLTVALVSACGGSSGEGGAGVTATAESTAANAPSPAIATTQSRSATSEPTTAHVPASATAGTTVRATATAAQPTPSIPSTTAAATTQSKTAEVKILDFRFDPPTLEIEAGTTVTFVNQGVDHTATAREDRSIFDTGILHSGESAAITFNTPGTIDYWCLLHPNMVATIVVR